MQRISLCSSPVPRRRRPSFLPERSNARPSGSRFPGREGVRKRGKTYLPPRRRSSAPAPRPRPRACCIAVAAAGARCSSRWPGLAGTAGGRACAGGEQRGGSSASLLLWLRRRVWRPLLEIGSVAGRGMRGDRRAEVRRDGTCLLWPRDGDGRKVGRGSAVGQAGRERRPYGR